MQAASDTPDTALTGSNSHARKARQQGLRGSTHFLGVSKNAVASRSRCTELSPVGRISPSRLASKSGKLSWGSTPAPRDASPAGHRIAAPMCHIAFKANDSDHGYDRWGQPVAGIKRSAVKHEYQGRKPFTC